MELAGERALLLKGAVELEVPLSPLQHDKLMAYLALLQKWNQAYNLSAVRNPRDMVERHLLDSLSVARLIEGQRLLDVGTGGGLPGIPLAILYPEREIGLLDSAGKKTRFLHQVTSELGLTNVHIRNCRAEAYRPDQLYDGIVSRAFASLNDFTRVCAHLLAPQGRFWAMKGQMPHEELQALESGFELEATHWLRVPGLDAQRCLLVIKPTAQI